MSRPRLSVGVLGPLEVRVRGRAVEVPRGKPQALVAALALSAGRVLHADVLAERLWGDQLPQRPRAGLQNNVLRLRRLIGPDLIRTTADGYLLEIEPDDVDALRFLRLLDAANTAPASGARDLLVEACGLWRGEPLAGIGSDSLERDYSPSLTERYLTALERRIDLDLGSTTEPSGPIAELRDLTARFPLRESLWERLLAALYRAGRQAEALDAYQRLRTTLVDTLGADPSVALRQLHQRILDEPRPPDRSNEHPDEQHPSDRPAPPAQLPFDTSDFVGRTAQIQTVVDWFSPPRDALTVAVVTGPGGIGKTTFAVHTAHRLVEADESSFAGGQLFARLVDADGRPRDPREILASFLRALGVASTAIPDEVDERAALYRSCLRGREVLVVLDDAVSEAQVRPLLPGTSTAGVLVTSRARLVGLEGARSITLDVLTSEQAFQLLSTVAGTDRFTGQREAGHEIAELCGHLPLAIRIAGCRLAARPHWRPQDLAGRLVDSRSRLDELTQGDLEVRATIAVSYETLDDTTRAAFRRLGLLDAPTFPGWVVAAALDQPIDGVEELMERLADARLLEVVGYDRTGQLRYRFHDLLRLYARERADVEDTVADRMGVIERALGGWLASAQLASAEIPCTFPGHPLPSPAWPAALEVTGPLVVDGYAWFDSEWAALVAGTEQACALGLVELAAGLASTASSFLHARGYLDEWRHIHEHALAVATGPGHRAARSLLLCDLGEVHCIQDRMDQAVACFTEAERLAREAGDRTREALVNSSLGYLTRLQSDYDESLTRYRRALTLARAVGSLVVQAHATQGLGNIHFDQGRPEQAATCFADALTLARECGFVECVVRALRGLAMVERQQGDLDNAIEHVRQALRELGVHQNPLGAAHASLDLADLYVLTGKLDDARQLYERCLPAFGEQSDRFGTGLTRRGLGRLYTEEGRYDDARQEFEESARIFAELALPLWQASALDGSSRVLAASGETERADELAEKARTLAEKAGGSVR